MANIFSKKIKGLENLNIPTHVAIIMDGNGRWAKSRFLSRSMGHKAGGETLRRIMYDATEIGIKYLTVYAFSTENWKRSEEEINNIMEIFLDFFKKYEDEFDKLKCRVKFMGRADRIPEKVWQTILEIEETSKAGDALQLNVAFNYGGRQEIVDAVNKIIASGQNSGEIDMEDISNNLYLPEVPDPDLIIRTSGEFRVSNFLLWESAYSEYYISNVYWPDFDRNELLKAIESYNKRDRRYGGVKNG